MRIFVTATGTGAGKTVVTRALALALRRAHREVVAIKPIETGCSEGPADARALGLACGRPELANARGLYRAIPPVAPYAATLDGGPPPPPLADLARAVRAASQNADDLLVEGAGGPLVPYDAKHDLLDLALSLELPILLVAQDTLGVLSHTLAAAHAVSARGGDLRAIVLNRCGEGDPSRATNRQILEERAAPTPVLSFAPRDLGELSLIEAVHASRMLEHFDLPPTHS